VLVSCKSTGGGFAAVALPVDGGGGAASTKAELATSVQHTKARRSSAPWQRMARD
jgi:hypothetical protein